MTKYQTQLPVVVVGGGLAGLTAATYLARDGVAVRVLESAASPGGRAMTQTVGGFQFNLGPHALYAKGAASLALNDLGVTVVGSPPSATGLYAVLDGHLRRLPSGVMALVGTDLLSVMEKLALAKLFGKLAKKGGEGWHGRTVAEWISTTTNSSTLALLLAALVRLSTYATEPELHDAGAALDQLALALAGNVLYLDGGWQTMVDGLRARAEEFGARVETRVKVQSIVAGSIVAGDSVFDVRLADGTEVAASHVILACGPEGAARLCAGAGVDRPSWSGNLRPVKAACLDLGLSRLPRPDRLFGLGLDEPMYLSVHSATATLCPDGMASVQVAKYLGAEASQSRESITAELEGFADQIQPGWREVVRERRLLPEMTVSNALVQTHRRRPDVAVEGVSGLYLAGDWVGAEGMLADAAVASARRVAGLILDSKTRARQAA